MSTCCPGPLHASSTTQAAQTLQLTPPAMASSHSALEAQHQPMRYPANCPANCPANWPASYAPSSPPCYTPSVT
eukprot:CAMPEP_0202897114 /NCGR_PEP_ID=MMETSP1392-20130828/5962_1 /ASSEMBLY_ACC=CAM_ASM_000868 /TAXON_ID=225041 /ORGANISM="Chlamydomonas chlamydogama, Strain SAG 11-48b" /LENGTH=73 /DNA_ID=CAMNT_0049582673 /DNA_START=400 /DNA_END=622 /DNA_ORIENTATION=+